MAVTLWDAFQLLLPPDPQLPDSDAARGCEQRMKIIGPQDDYVPWKAGALWISPLHGTVVLCLSFLIQRASRLAPVTVAARLSAARAPAASRRLDRPSPGEWGWARADLATCLSERWKDLRHACPNDVRTAIGVMIESLQGRCPGRTGSPCGFRNDGIELRDLSYVDRELTIRTAQCLLRLPAEYE